MKTRVIVVGTALFAAACGEEDDDSFALCEPASSSRALEVQGRFDVRLDYQNAHNPGQSFRAFVADVHDAGAELRACQVDAEGLLWRFDTVWTGIPPRAELPAAASFRLGSLPTRVTGRMTRCLDENCSDQSLLLSDTVPLSRDAIEVQDFSADDGVFEGFLIQTVGRTADGSALVTVDFALNWAPGDVP